MISEVESETDLQTTQIDDGEPNTEFSYLYRDASNSKFRGTIVLAGRATPEQTDRLMATLIDGEFFVAEEVGVPSCFPWISGDHLEGDPVTNRIWEIDHGWHEFDDLSPTRDAPTTPRTVEDLVASFEQAARPTPDQRNAPGNPRP